MSRRAFPLVAIFGVLLGLAARGVDFVAPHSVGDVAAVWVLVAFLAGANASEERRGAILGVVCLTLASLTYYSWRVWIDQTISLSYLMLVGSFWMVAAVATGLLAGSFGARSRLDARWWGLVSGAFLGEAIAIMVLRHNLIQTTIEIAIALLCLIPARRTFAKAVALAGASALLLASIGIGYRMVLGRGKAIHRSGLAPHVT